MSSTLTLKRAATGAAELRRSSFEIILDGKPAGSIERLQTVELQVQPGPHTLRVKAGRCSSPAKNFDAADDANVNAAGPLSVERYRAGRSFGTTWAEPSRIRSSRVL